MYYCVFDASKDTWCNGYKVSRVHYYTRRNCGVQDPSKLLPFKLCIS